MGTECRTWGVGEEPGRESALGCIGLASARRSAGGAVQSWRGPGRHLAGPSGPQARAAAGGGEAKARASASSTRNIHPHICTVTLMHPIAEASFCFIQPY